MTQDLDPNRNAILSQLTQVGPAKPVGYLPLYTITDLLQMNPHVLADEASASGRSVALFGPDQCCIKSGALYVFDRQSLQTLMQSSTSLLLANGWPLEPDEFVARIACEWIDQSHPLAPLIKRAFGENQIVV
jgi:hypothetical protein